MVRAFADEQVAPQAYEADRTKTSRWTSWRRWGRWGCSVCRSPRRSADRAAITLRWDSRSKPSARVDQSIAITLEAAVSLGAMPSSDSAPTRSEALLPDLLAGRALAGFGLTEPEAGSDAGSTRTTARLEGAEWVIDGASSSSRTPARPSRVRHGDGGDR
jgi:alkylation response protein AidB-like acyl-CoA dehydrogenase